MKLNPNNKKFYQVDRTNLIIHLHNIIQMRWNWYMCHPALSGTDAIFNKKMHGSRLAGYQMGVFAFFLIFIWNPFSWFRIWIETIPMRNHQTDQTILWLSKSKFPTILKMRFDIFTLNHSDEPIYNRTID